MAAARAELARRKDAHEAELDRRLAEPAERLDGWVARSRQLAFSFDERRRRDREHYTRSVAADTTQLIESMRTAGQPLVRVLAVLVPRHPGGGL